MSEAMSDTDTSDLSAHEFTISCEHAGCDQPAIVMGKGCPDERHIAVCEGHYRWIRELFESMSPHVVCHVCDRRMVAFSEHFDIVEI